MVCGPFKVLQHVGKTVYKLDLQGHFTGVHNIFHVSQLRPHVPVEVEALLNPHSQWRWKVKPTMRLKHYSSIGKDVVEGNILYDGQGMAQNMMSGYMKASWSMPKTC